MRLQISVLALLFTSDPCLAFFRAPNTACSRATRSTILSTTRSATSIARAELVPRPTEFLHERAIDKIYRVLRGGAHESKSIVPLSNAAVFPIVQGLPPQLRTAFLVNTIGFTLLEATGKRGSILTTSGMLNAWILGLVLWGTLGGWGWATCVLYLWAGSAVTKLKIKKKESMGIAEGRGGARGPENVWGSAATGAMCAVASAFWLPKWATLLKVGYVSSLATKLSDTFASEVGKAYGKRTFLITTLKPVPPGTEGAVSLEGTLAGVGGSLVIAAFAGATGVIGAKALPACLIAAFVATNFESVLGATTQGKLPWLTNEVINFVNTLVGAAIGIGLGFAGFA